MKLYQKEIWNNEKTKYKSYKKKKIAAWAVLLVISIFIGFSGVLYSSVDGRNINIELLKIYRDYEWRMEGEVDETFIQERQEKYKYFVDKYRASDEEIEENRKTFNVDLPLEDILYDPNYAYMVITDIFYNALMHVGDANPDASVYEMYQILDQQDIEFAEDYVMFEGLMNNGSGIINYAKDPVSILVNGINPEFYPENLQQDMIKTAQRYAAGKPVVSGSIQGWDVRICLMQILPFTLSILILLSCFRLFSTERQHNVQDLLATSKYGRGQLSATKLLMAMKSSTLYWITFQAVFFVVTTSVLGFEGWNATYYSPLGESIYGFYCWQYYLAQLIISYCGTLFFTLFVCMLSSLLPSLVTLLIGIGLIASTSYPILLYEFSDKSYTALHKLKALLPTQLMGGFNTYRTYQGFAIGEFVIRLPLASYITIILGSVFCIWVICKRTKVIK